MATVNSPAIWRSVFPIPKSDGHKYDRGHTVVLGSGRYTGATRLAAEACSRVGSGLVTVLSAMRADIYRATLPADIMVSDGELSDVRRPSTILAGPGGCSDEQAATVLSADPAINLVLDADAIRLHDNAPAQTRILTPHEGEFERYFGAIGAERDEAAQKVSALSQSIFVLKGAQTLISGPDGRLVRNETASPFLAKAGTGDVLAGLIAGLVAQGMPAFEAAAAGVWIHGRASERIGVGLIPQDLITELRPVLREALA